MRIETTDSSVKLIEALDGGQWAVRWDFKAKPDAEGINWYEEEIFNHIPQMDEIIGVISLWEDKQIDGAVANAMVWKGYPVYLSSENLFNFFASVYHAIRREERIEKWDKEHPDLAGITYIAHNAVDEDGNTMEMQEPTGRPVSVLPKTFRLGTAAEAQFYTFTSVEELEDFFDSCLEYVQGCYNSGWMAKATFDFAPYAEVLNNL